MDKNSKWFLVLAIVLAVALVGVGFFAFNTNSDLKDTKVVLVSTEKDLSNTTNELDSVQNDLVNVNDSLSTANATLSTAYDCVDYLLNKIPNKTSNGWVYIKQSNVNYLNTLCRPVLDEQITIQ